MNHLQIEQTAKYELSTMSEAEAATWYHKQGVKIVYHLGRYWKESRFGFYEPLHLLARLTAEQATCPRRLSLGFRASLREADAAVANGFIPVRLLSDVNSYDVQSLSSNRRNHLRRCHKRAKIVQLSSPALLQEQGYEVYCSALTRFGGTKITSKQAYLSHVESYSPSKQRYVFAGLIDDKLGGYIVTYAIDQTAYIEKVLLATEALSAYIGIGLVFEFVQACRCSGKIREIVYGYDTPNDPALGTFKEGLGFPVRQIPSRVAVNPMIDPILRWRYPSAYYFMTGKDVSTRI
jgi:hypothetical protein